MRTKCSPARVINFSWFSGKGEGVRELKPILSEIVFFEAMEEGRWKNLTRRTEFLGREIRERTVK